MASNLPGQGVNWSAFQDISRSHLEGGKAFAEGIGQAFGGLAAGLNTMFERKQKAKMAAEQRAHEMSMQEKRLGNEKQLAQEKDRLDQRWREIHSGVQLRLASLDDEDRLFGQGMRSMEIELESMFGLEKQYENEINTYARRGPEYVPEDLRVKYADAARRRGDLQSKMQERYEQYRLERSRKSDSILSDLSTSMDLSRAGIGPIPQASDLGQLPQAQPSGGMELVPPSYSRYGYRDDSAPNFDRNSVLAGGGEPVPLPEAREFVYPDDEPSFARNSYEPPADLELESLSEVGPGFGASGSATRQNGAFSGAPAGYENDPSFIDALPRVGPAGQGATPAPGYVKSAGDGITDYAREIPQRGRTYPALRLGRYRRDETGVEDDMGEELPPESSGVEGKYTDEQIAAFVVEAVRMGRRDKGPLESMSEAGPGLGASGKAARQKFDTRNMLPYGAPAPSDEAMALPRVGPGFGPLVDGMDDLPPAGPRGEAGASAPAGAPSDAYREFADNPKLYSALQAADRASTSMLDDEMRKINLRLASEKLRVKDSIETIDKTVQMIDQRIAAVEQDNETLERIHGGNPTDSAKAKLKKNSLEMERLNIKKTSLTQRSGEVRRAAEMRLEEITIQDQEEKVAAIRKDALSKLGAWNRISELMEGEGSEDISALRMQRAAQMESLIRDQGATFQQAEAMTRDMKLKRAFDPAQLRIERHDNEANRMNRRLDQELALHRAGEEEVTEDVYTQNVRGLRWRDLSWPAVTKVILDNRGGTKQTEAVWGAMMRPEVDANPNFDPNAKNVTSNDRQQEIDKRLAAVRKMVESMVDENERIIVSPEDENRARAYWGRRFMAMFDLEPGNNGKAQFVKNPRYIRTRPPPQRDENY